jgi:hypothetical protein
MVRTVRKTLGGALALLCLASTLAIADGRTMTCLQVDGKGNCTSAAGPDGKEIVVVGDNIDKGALMSCVDKGYMVACEKLQ